MGAVVLVVEDERKIREMLRGYLEREGYGVLTAGTGAEALELAGRVHPDLVLLDLRLPDVAGEDVAAQLHTESGVPILVLTAKVSEADRIRGLEAGADDYVTKPFSPRELMLRVRAILRRGRGTARVDLPATFDDGVLVIDDDRHEVRVDGHLVHLTPTEYGILTCLARTPGRVYSRYELINQVRGYEFDGYERAIDSHVKNLRRKVERDPRQPHLVETVVGAGYRLGVTRDG